MVNRLPSWFFLATALVLIGIALMPLVRVALGIDTEFSLQFWTVVMFLIGGLMSGLTAMILLAKRAPRIDWGAKPIEPKPEHKSTIIALHSCGLLLYTGIPLLNFLICYWIWIKNRSKDQAIAKAGEEVLNFQISIYLYLLLSLFMMFAVIGLFSTPAILLFHLLVTLIAIVMVMLGKRARYPLIIPVIQGRAQITE